MVKRYIVRERDTRVGGYTVREYHAQGNWSAVIAWFATRVQAKAFIG